MNEEDIKTMFKLMKEYSEEEMDQWDSWKFNSKYGKVYISFDRKSNGYEDSYNDISELLEQEKK